MKHGSSTRKLGRVTKQRTALLRSLAISLIKHGKIKTTEAKAKELRPYIEKLVTRGKKDSIASRRIISSRLGSGGTIALNKLFTEISPKYTKRDGGYTRVTKLPSRQGDASPMAVIEFV